MQDINIPKSLHEVFGEKQSILEISATIIFALTGTCLIYFLLYQPAADLETWRVLLGFILIADVLAGCIANFSRGTNNFYAASAKSRLVFIAIHVHLLAIAWLLTAPFDYALLIWFYTIVSALTVNYFKGQPLQTFISASLLCSGLFLVLLVPLPTWFLITSVFFMMKVTFSFAVDHYRDAS